MQYKNSNSFAFVTLLRQMLFQLFQVSLLSLLLYPKLRYFPRLTRIKKTNFMTPFYGWGSSASRLEPLQGDILLFTTKFPEVPGTHFINVGRMKD